MAAKVESIEALKQFRAALCTFLEKSRASLGEADTELGRIMDWLRQDRTSHWKAEIRRRTELVTRAKLALQSKQLSKTAGGGRPSCVDEEKALTLAIRRLEEAEQKAANTRRWLRKFDEEVFEYKGNVQGLTGALDADLPNAIAKLGRMLDALDAYTGITPGEATSAAPSAAPVADVNSFPAGGKETTS